MPVENVNDLGEVRQRPGQPVNLVDDHHIDLTCAHIRQQPLESRAFHRCAREPSVVIHFADKAPAFALLAGDESLASFALGVERVEVLFQPFLAALAGIDRTSKSYRGAIRRRSISHWRSPSHRPIPVASGSNCPFDAGLRIKPKNRGPDQWAPVMAWAILVSDGKILPAYSNPSSITTTVWGLPLHSSTNLVPDLTDVSGVTAMPPLPFSSLVNASSLRWVALLNP